MAPKIIVTKDQILSGGVSLVKALGIEALNARSLAQRLSTSTTPVVQAFGTMENLKTRIIQALYQELELKRTQLSPRFSPRPWMARLGAYALYAWKHPQGYRVLRDLFWVQDSGEAWKSLVEDVGADQEMGDLSPEVVAQQAFRLNVYTAGFAEMAARGLLFNPTEEGILKDLEEALRLLMKGINHDFPTLA